MFQGKTTSWLYDTLGRVQRQTHANGTYAEYSYDLRSRVTQADHRKANGQLIQREATVYDPAGNVTSRTLTGQQVYSSSYLYDNADRLREESSSDRPTVSYTFDANGNRETKTVGTYSESYAYDNADKLLSVTWAGGSKVFGYDGAGPTRRRVGGGMFKKPKGSKKKRRGA